MPTCASCCRCRCCAHLDYHPALARPSLDHSSVGDGDSSGANFGETTSLTRRRLAATDGVAAPPPATFTVDYEQDPRWPKAMVIGVQKAATTSVFGWLSERVNISCRMQNTSDTLSPQRWHFFTGKETHFFDMHGWELVKASLTAERMKEFTERYLAHFRSDAQCVDSLRMEATPDYLSEHNTAFAMHRMFPPQAQERLRLVVLLRDPVLRLVSWYNHQVCRCQPKEGVPVEDICHHRRVYNAKEKRLVTLEEFFRAHRHDIITRREHGAYYFHLTRWLTYFKRSQIMILNFEAVSNPATQRDALLKIAAFVLDKDVKHVEEHYRHLMPPGVEPFELEQRNSFTWCTRTVQTSCQVWGEYSQLYKPYTDALYALLAKTQEARHPLEPDFEPFHEGDAVRARCENGTSSAANVVQ